MFSLHFSPCHPVKTPFMTAVQAGAQGCLRKGAPRQELFNAIRIVLQNCDTAVCPIHPNTLAGLQAAGGLMYANDGRDTVFPRYH